MAQKRKVVAASACLATTEGCWKMMGKEETLAETEISWPMTALRNNWSNNRATSGTIWGGGGGDVQNYCHWTIKYFIIVTYAIEPLLKSQNL